MGRELLFSELDAKKLAFGSELRSSERHRATSIEKKIDYLKKDTQFKTQNFIPPLFFLLLVHAFIMNYVGCFVFDSSSRMFFLNNQPSLLTADAEAGRARREVAIAP